jgi:hypothetical protein
VPFCGRPPPNTEAFITNSDEDAPIAQRFAERVTQAAAAVREWLFLPNESLQIR